MLVIKKESDIVFTPYQRSAEEYPDIPKNEFKKASRLITPDGSVFSGPDSAYKALTYLNKPVYFLHKWYCKSGFFRWLSDRGYSFIAKNRPLMMKLTILFFGKNPINRKPFWLVGLFCLLLLFLVCT